MSRSVGRVFSIHISEAASSLAVEGLTADLPVQEEAGASVVVSTRIAAGATLCPVVVAAHQTTCEAGNQALIPLSSYQ